VAHCRGSEDAGSTITIPHTVATPSGAEYERFARVIVTSNLQLIANFEPGYACSVILSKFTSCFWASSFTIWARK
jgi:hypothetical protein